MVVTIKITAFWNVTPYSLVDRYNVSEEPPFSVFGVEDSAILTILP
jgi:hypothetical protein